MTDPSAMREAMSQVGWVVAGFAFVIGFVVAAWMRRRASLIAVLEARQAADAELSTLREQLRAREERVAELSRQASHAEGQLESTQERLVSLTGEVGSLRAVAERVEELKVQLARREEEVDGLQQTLAVEQSAHARIQSLLESQGRELSAHEADAAASAAEVDVLRAEKNRLTEEQARLSAQLDAATTRLGEQATELAAARARVQALEDEARTLVAEATRLSSELSAQQALAAERATEEEKARGFLRTELENTTTRLLEEKGGAMLNLSQQQLQGLIEPLKEKLLAFEQKVEKTYDQDNRDRASLLEHLKHLQEAQARLHEDAQGLARALTGDSKTQGDWGELTLQRLLEMAGLSEHVNYDVQVTGHDEDGGRRRPDVVLHLPQDRAVIVDSKCSLTAFVEAMAATTPEARSVALKAHAGSVKQHVKELADKQYQALLKQRTLDNVLLFIPSEPAFHAAISEDGQLFDYAFNRGIVIVSPTTLLPSLQLIAQMWRSEKQAANAQRIARDAGRLIDKLSSFLKDLDGVGKALGDAQAKYDEARKKLATGKGNVLKKAKDLAQLGAAAKPESVAALQDGSTEDDDEPQGTLELGPGAEPDDEGDAPSA